MRSHRRDSVLALAAMLVLAPLTEVRAAAHVVTTLVDVIPAPPGSLRAAIEAAEGNGEPDRITFAVIGAIHLVAPLPDLTEGDLSIDGGPSIAAVPKVRLSGGNSITSAFTSRGPRNAIENLEFEGFAKAAVRILGGGAIDNDVRGCRFGIFGPISSANRIGVQVAGEAASVGFPDGARLSRLAFEGNDSAIRVEGNNVPIDPAARPTQIVDCDIGSRGLVPAGSNGEALHATAPVVVESSRFAADATAPSVPRGVYLGSGADGSRILRSRIGLGRAPRPSVACGGWNFTPAGIVVENAREIVIADNEIGCHAGDGILLGTGARAVEVRDNDIGTAGAATSGGNRRDGVRIEGGIECRVFRNRVHDNGGYGLALASNAAGHLIACNEMRANVQGLIFKAGGLVGPPQFLNATPTTVQGALTDPGPGWVDVYSGSAPDEPDDFLTSLSIGNDAIGFRGRVPADGVRFVPSAAIDPPWRCLRFDLDLGDQNLGTAYRRDLSEVSVFSPEIANPPAARAHDVLRGQVENLALVPGGTVSLGPLACVASNVQPQELPVCDDAMPHPGFALFYVVVRRDLLSNDIGSFDASVCGPFPTGQVATRVGTDVCQ